MLTQMHKIMKTHSKPTRENSTTRFIEQCMEHRDWSLVDAIEALESGYPFYDAYDVLAQFINYGLFWHAFIFFLKRRLANKGKIYFKDWKTVIKRLLLS